MKTIRRAVIKMKDGREDWVDPVYGVSETQDTLSVDNGCYVYDFKKSEIVSHEVVDVEIE